VWGGTYVNPEQSRHIFSLSQFEIDAFEAPAACQTASYAIPESNITADREKDKTWFGA